MSKRFDLVVIGSGLFGSVFKPADEVSECLSGTADDVSLVSR